MNWAMEHFGVKTEMSTANGRDVVTHFYPYRRGSNVVAYKRRGMPKDLSCVGDFKDLELFGQAEARASGGRKLYLSEGEMDCVSIYQALKTNSQGTQWANLDPAVVSICSGSNSAVRDISRNMSFIKSFESVILVFDSDEPGQLATKEVLKLLPEALVVILDEKDPNDMILKGKSSQLAKTLLFKASRQKPSSIVDVGDLYERAIKRPQWGLSWPWPSLTKSTYGINRKKIYGLGAGVGLGKTEGVKEIQAHLINVHKLTVGIISLEEDPSKTLKALAGKFDGRMYHKPDEEYLDDDLKNAIENLRGKVFLYEHKGERDWEDIKAAIRYMVVVENCKDIFLDPLSAVVSSISSGEANDKLNSIMSDIAAMVHELDFTVYWVGHLNVPQSGPPHEMGGEPLESQLTGSRAMMRFSDYIFMLKGNKSPELPIEERNSRQLIVRKDRDFGNVCSFNLFYNNKTGTLREPGFTIGGY